MSMFDFIPGKHLVWDPLKKATGLTDAQMAGAAALAIAAPYALPAVGSAGAGATGASAAGTTGGLLNFAGTQAAAPIADMSVAAAPGSLAGIQGAGSSAGMSAYANPMMQSLQGASMAKGLLSQEQQQPQAPQLPQYQDMSGLLSANNQQMAQLEAKRMARRQGLLGGVYG